MKRRSSSTKGQVYTIDFLLAIILLIATVIISFKLVFNTDESSDYQILQLEARAISDSFLTEGLPANWTSSNVLLPGILSNKKISSAKLQELKSLGYKDASGLLNTRKNFYFYFTNSSGLVNLTFCGFGALNDTCTLPEVDSYNLARIDRVVVHEQRALKMVMLVWE